MDRLSVVLICQLHLFITITAYQSSEFFPFFSQNDTKNFENNEQFQYNTPINHSIYRRQASLNILTSQQARIPITPSYIILGPRVVRPAQIVSISVTILRKTWNPIMVKALISNDDMAIAAAEDLFTVNVPRTLQMRIPKSIRYGTYHLTIQGTLLTGEQKFSNISQLIFEQKAVSILIQLDRPVYRHETVIQFRCIPIYPDLSGYFHTLDAYILGPSGHILRKWENQQTTAGIVSLEYPINDGPPEGFWTVKCRVMGYEATKQFDIHEFYNRKFEVNVTVPYYLPTDTPGIGGILTANYTTGMGVLGYARIVVRARNMSTAFDPYNYPLADVEFDKTTPTYTTTIQDFNGVAGFFIPIQNIRTLLPDLDGNELLITAVVHDPWWNETNNGTTIVSFYTPGTRLRFLGGPSMVFKPRMIFTTYVAATNVDGSKYPPGPGRYIRIYTDTDLGQSQAPIDYMIDSSGIIQHKFLAPADLQVTFIRLRAELYNNNIKVEGSYDEQRAIRYLSPSNSYLQVTSSTEKPRVGDYMLFRVNITQYVDSVYYHITSAGKLIFTNILPMDGARQKTFDVGISREMAPSAHILVYYVRYDGEIVADSMNFHIDTSSVTNHVNITVNRRKDFTGNTIEVIAYASPQSYVAFAGLGLVQTRLFPPGNHFTSVIIYDELYSFDRYSTTSFQHTWYSDINIASHRVFFSSQSYGYDAGSTFNSSGMQIFTDVNIQAIQQTACNQFGLLQCTDGSCYPLSLKCNNVLDCRDGSDEVDCNVTINANRYNFTPLYLRLWPFWERELQLDFMWHQQFAYPDGRVQFRTTVPNVIATWVITALAVSRLTGFGIVEVPFIYEGTRQFFIKVEVPPIVRLGEQVGARVDVFNFQPHRIEALIILHASDDYRSVNIGQRGIVSSYSPKLTEGQHHVLVILYPNEVRRLYIPFVPIVAGEIEVMIEGITGVSRDFYREVIKVNYEGIRNYYHTPTVLLLNNLPRQVNEYDITVPEHFILPLANTWDYISGSATCEIFISGDVAGPYFLLGYDEWLNTDNLIQRTTAPGDSGIFDFAMMIYNLRYMLQGHGGRAFDEQKLLQVLIYANMEYLRFMAMYVNSYPDEPWREGSFSQFGFNNETSVWMTAWTLMTLRDAVYPEWEEKGLYIDPNLRSDIVKFLITNQKTNGSWAETTTVEDRNKFGLRLTNVSGTYQQLNLSLTAQALIALQLNVDIRGIPAKYITGAIQRAKQWLEQHFRLINDAFDMAIVTYALHLTNSAEQDAAFARLTLFKRMNENGIYYSNLNLPAMTKTWPNVNPRYGPKPVPTNFEAHAVSATAFVVMTYTHKARVKEAEQAVLWLQSMRNFIGGWSATYDSCMAQRAIVGYAVLRGFEITAYNIRINLTSSSSNEESHDPVVITDGNLIDTQVRDVERAWGVVYIDGFGNGYALIQMHVGVNVEFNDKVRRPAYVPFYVDVQPMLSGRNFSTIDYHICLSWRTENVDVLKATHSGSMFFEIQIPTGYRVEEKDLKTMIWGYHTRNLREAENWPGQVNFGFEYIDFNPICFQFQAKRWIPIANISRYYEVRAYEWFEPANINRSVYTLRNLFALDICEVCGSYQCPYCPYYGQATVFIQSITMIILVSFIVFYNHSSTVSRPYIGSGRNRQYIYNKLSSPSLLSNDYFFSSKSFLPNQSKYRTYLSNDLPVDTLQERVDKEFISSPTLLDERQVYQGQKTKDFLSSSSSSSLFLLPTTQNKTSSFHTCYDLSSSPFTKEQQKIPQNESQYSYYQSSPSGYKNNQSFLSDQLEYSQKRKSFPIENYHIDRNNNSIEEKNSFLSPRLFNETIVVNKDNDNQIYSNYHPKTSDTIFSLLSSTSNENKSSSKLSNNIFDRSSSLIFPTDHRYKSDSWKYPKMSVNLDNNSGSTKYSYEQRISDQGNKYTIQLTTDSFEENEFKLTPYYSRHELVVDAKHVEEDSYGGFIRRELHKIFPIPKHIDLSKHTYTFNKTKQELIIELSYLHSTTTTNENKMDSSFISSIVESNPLSTMLYGDRHSTNHYNNTDTNNINRIPPSMNDSSKKTTTSVTVTTKNDPSIGKTKPFDFDLFHRSAFQPQILGGTSNDNTHEKKLLMSLDLTDYQPEDIQVSIKDQELIVKAERKTQTDTRKSRTSFFQSTSLPPQTDIEHLKSNYIDGKLVIEAPYLERNIKTANNTTESNNDTVIKSEQKSVEEDPYQQRTETVIEFIRRRRL
ncbi:unnamed protein product [Adineta steineri]|uniref:SHSP domain-containing protein n=1 Tax=Adineta steineri TaxID=433720 RepID=A0A814Q2S7_9BILA|nr:unnamed protein product [Adineta steineri]CAF3671663.1 unnamed protein product [Adineta steineri]